MNFALTQTSPDAEIIATIDADYQLDPDFLRALVPAFADPQVAFAQTPQDYRDYQGHPFTEATYYGYGLMPFTFDGLKRQRFRWRFGGIQILRKHWEALMPWARWARLCRKTCLESEQVFSFQQFARPGSLTRFRRWKT